MDKITTPRQPDLDSITVPETNSQPPTESEPEPDLLKETKPQTSTEIEINPQLPIETELDLLKVETEPQTSTEIDPQQPPETETKPQTETELKLSTTKRFKSYTINTKDNDYDLGMLDCPNNKLFGDAESVHCKTINFFFEKLVIIKNDDNNDGDMDFYEYKTSLIKWRDQTEDEAEKNALTFFAQWRGKCRDIPNSQPYMRECNPDEIEFLHNAILSWKEYVIGNN